MPALPHDSLDALAQRVASTRRFCQSLTRYERLPTRAVDIGGVPMGGSHPIRIQSMTTTDTMDTEATVQQTLRMVAAGCEYVRITAPSKKEAEHLAVIQAELRKRGCQVPLVADIHFTPNAAEVAARIVAKVRVNPGNYADKKQFKTIDYTDAAYAAELARIRERFAPLVKVCQEHGTVMRIGTNHGSLSDRILSRYGDTPEGMVESALEFIRICEDLGYFELVVSMKASNPQVMVQAYRLLAARMLAGDTRHIYPLHVGVTEAGDGEDGRIKSAMGIGTLLADGLGDTVRVSLTEPPEAEMPVGRYLVQVLTPHDAYPAGAQGTETPAPSVNGGLGATVPHIGEYCIDPYAFARRTARQVANFGGAAGHHELPRVVADFSAVVLDEYRIRQVGHVYWPESDKWTMLEQGCDYVYTGAREVPFMLPTGTKAVYDATLWAALPAGDKAYAYPYFAELNDFLDALDLDADGGTSPALNFVRLTLDDCGADNLRALGQSPVPVVVVAEAETALVPQELRQVAFLLILHGVDWPLVLRAAVVPDAAAAPEEPFANRYALSAAAQLGMLLVDGLCDGLWLLPPPELPDTPDTADGADTAPEASAKPWELANRTAFGLLQSARMRTTKTEYISCPSCGRTLFDLQETTAKIRARTEHLKGVKIGIMGCIVNGPGEMADADYGYVGAGPGVISLWRGKEQVKPKVPTEAAVDELIALIREDGKWVEPG